MQILMVFCLKEKKKKKRK